MTNKVLTYGSRSTVNGHTVSGEMDALSQAHRRKPAASSQQPGAILRLTKTLALTFLHTKKDSCQKLSFSLVSLHYFARDIVSVEDDVSLGKCFLDIDDPLVRRAAEAEAGISERGDEGAVDEDIARLQECFFVRIG